MAEQGVPRAMLSIRGLSKRFPIEGGAVTALDNVSFDVNQGELFVLVGGSGSGKTTLPLREGAQRVHRREVERRVHQALDLVRLEELAHRPATLLSGGQQQRVALARAIAVNSRMLLMDEPLSNLDARLRQDVRERIRDLAKQLGSTVVYVTHDQVEAMAIADRVGLLRRGALVHVGSPVELYWQPCEPEVADFFGQMNWLQGTIVHSPRRSRLHSALWPSPNPTD